MLFVIGWFTTAYAQDCNEKLLVKFTQEEINAMQEKDVLEYEYWCMYVTTECYFVDMPDKPITYRELKKVDKTTGKVIENFVFTEDDFSNFNPLNYDIKPDQEWNTYYRAGNTGKLLIVISDTQMRNDAINSLKIKKLNLKN
jgi:mRNA-degrading endonuclease RelE of RelBE toxin-antitoxin system